MADEARTVKLVDLPMVSRLLERTVPLDSEMACTGTLDLGTAALVSRFLLPQRSVCTLLARRGGTQVVGQFRVGQQPQRARIVAIAPGLEPRADNSAWLALLDAMTAAAGQRGAHLLSAEVDEHQALFETMRIAGFSIYARQEIWQRRPEEVPRLMMDAVELTVEQERDTQGIQLLYGNIVPRLVQPVAEPPAHSVGLVYRKHERVEGHVAVSEGRKGIYLSPCLHPDVFSEASAILAAAIDHAHRSRARVPVYVAVRRYQDWLEDALVDLGFVPWTRQAVMLRHIAAGVRQTAFAPLARGLEAVPGSLKPPATPAVQDGAFDPFGKEE